MLLFEVVFVLCVDLVVLLMLLLFCCGGGGVVVVVTVICWCFGNCAVKPLFRPVSTSFTTNLAMFTGSHFIQN